MLQAKSGRTPKKPVPFSPLVSSVHPEPYQQANGRQERHDHFPRQMDSGMKSIAEYAVFLGKELMQVTVKVTFVNTSSAFLACYGQAICTSTCSGSATPGSRRYQRGSGQAAVHEFGHQYSGDHLSGDTMKRCASWLQRSRLWLWRNQTSFAFQAKATPSIEPFQGHKCPE